MRAFVLIVMMSGCAHVPPAQPAPAPACPTLPQPAMAASATPSLYDLRWQLSVAPEPARVVNDDLSTFTIGRWECALGKTQVDDAREGNQLRLARSRKLACTHASGNTVQTSLACEVVTGSPAPPVHKLPLLLDTAPTLTFSCAAVPVDQLVSALGAMCATPEGVTYCSTR